VEVYPSRVKANRRNQDYEVEEAKEVRQAKWQRKRCWYLWRI